MPSTCYVCMHSTHVFTHTDIRHTRIFTSHTHTYQHTHTHNNFAGKWSRKSTNRTSWRESARTRTWRGAVLRLLLWCQAMTTAQDPIASWAVIPTRPQGLLCFNFGVFFPIFLYWKINSHPHSPARPGIIPVVVCFGFVTDIQALLCTSIPVPDGLFLFPVPHTMRSALAFQICIVFGILTCCGNTQIL
jgi:hypothetical protein